MATEVEERIVAAKFDSSDFEKGVDKTVKKLDELKESLDFKKTGESLEKLGKKTTEATEAAGKSIERLTERFTTFTGMVKQKILGGFADQVVNTFFRMQSAVTSFIKSISTNQIGAGMQRYENMLTAVRMITNATYLDKITKKKENYTQEAAYEAMEKLQAYTDETSYSLDQMTDAMSKMVAAGVELDTATKNVMGIANACAYAGVNAQDASRAFFNLSQAYSSGFLKYTDYRSLELLNMTNEGFMEQLIAAGEAAGTLKKTKDGVWKTKKSDKNKKVTAGKTVTMKSLSESLRYNWADNNVMDLLFGKNFYADIDEIEHALYVEGKSMSEVLDDLEKKYGKVAAQAFGAAREARNFTDVFNTWRDMVATSWSKTWEMVFGRLEDATKFFTDLADGGIANFIRDVFGFRNTVLETWNEGNTGGEAFRQMILQIDEALGQLLGIFTDLLPSTDEFSKVLIELTADMEWNSEQFLRWAKDVREWLNSSELEGGETRIEKIRRALANLSGIFTVLGRLADIAIQTINHALSTLSPIVDAVINGIVKLTEPIGELGAKDNTKPFQLIADSISNLFLVLDPLMKELGPFISKLGELLGGIGGFFIQMSIDTVVMNLELIADLIRLVIELFGGEELNAAAKGESVIGKITEDINSLKEVCSTALKTVKEFFDTLIKDLRTILGLPAEEGQAAGEINQEGGLFAGVKNFFETNEFIQQAQAWVEQAKNDIIKWFSDLPQTISNFINGLLYKEQTTVYQTGGYAPEIVKKQIETPLKQWLDTTVDTVAKFIADIPTKLLEGIGTIGNFVSMVINAIFGSKDGAEAKKDVDTKKQEDQTTNAIKEWADKFSERFQKEIKLLPMRIRMYIRIYSRKMKATWKNFKTWFNNDETISTIKEWGASIFNSIKDFILKLPEHIMNLIKSVGATGRSIIGTIKELFKSDDVSKETQKELEDGFNGISIQGVLNTIADIGKEIVNQFLSWFTGSEDMAGNFEWLGEQVSNMIKAIPAAIEGAVDWVILQLGNLWDNLYKALVGEKDQNGKDKDPVNSRVKEKLDELTDKNGNLNLGIENIVELARSAFEDAGKILGNLWDDLINALTGKNKKTVTPKMWRDLDKYGPEKQLEVKQGWAKEGFNVPGVKIGFEKFVDDLGKAIVDLFAKIPGWITEGLNVAVTGINAALEWLTNNLSANIGKSEEEVAENVDKNNPAASGLEASFTKLGTNISNLIFKTIPAAISAGFERVKNDAINVWWPSLLSIFDGINNNVELQEQFSNVGTNIVAWIDALPKRIKEAFYTLKLKIDSFFHPDAMIGDPRFIGKETKEALDKAGKETKDSAEQSTLWDIIKSIVINIGDAFKRAFDSLWPDVSSWFANLPTYIVEGLTVGVNTIGSAFDGIGTFFDQLVNSKDAEEMATKAMEDVQKATEEGVEKGAENKDQKSSFVTAITGLGSAIWKVITENIPKAIIGAFNWVRDNWNSWIDSLRGIFSAVTGTDIGEIDITTIINSIRSAIESLPEKISSAWATVKEQIAKIFKGNNKGILTKEDYAKLVSVPKKETKDIPTLLPDFLPKPRDFAKDVKNQLDETGIEVSKEAEESSLFDALLDVGKQIGTIISSGIEWAINNLGDVVVNGWNNALDTISKLLGSMGEWLAGGSNQKDGSLGEAISNNFGNIEPGLKTALESIGLTIKNLFIHTIPRFIGDAIGTIIHDLPTMWGELWTGISETATKSSEEQTKDNKELVGAEEALKDTGNILNEMLETVKVQMLAGTLSTTAGIIVGLLALMEIFKLIKEVISTFNVSGNMAERMEAKNSIEAVFKRMLTAMIAAMALVAYVSTLDETQFNRVKEILDKLLNTLQLIAGVYGVASSIKGAGDIATALAGGKDDDVKDATKVLTNKQKGINGLLTIWDGISSATKGVLGAAAVGAGIDIVGTSISDVISQLLGNFGDMGGAISRFQEAIGTAFDEIGGVLDKIENAKKVLDAIVNSNDGLLPKISEITTYKDAVKTADGIFSDLTGSFGLFAKQFEGDLHPTEVVQAIKDVMGMTKEMTEFADYTTETDAFERFKYAIASLGSSLSFYNSGSTMSEEMTTTGISNAVKVLKAIIGDEELMGLASIISSGELSNDSDNFYKGAEQLMTFAGALSQFGNAISGFTTESVDAFSKFYNDVISKITIEDIHGEGEEGVGSFAQRMHTLGSGLSSFAASAKDLKQDDVKVAGYALDMLASIAERAKHFQHGVVAGWIAGTGDLGQFANQIGGVGSQLKAFLDSVSMTEDKQAIEIRFETIKSAMFALQQLSVAASRLKGTNGGSLKSLLSNFSDGETLGNAVSKFIGRLFYTFDYTREKYKKIDPNEFDLDFAISILAAFNNFASSVAKLSSGNTTSDKTFGAIIDSDHGIVKIAEKIIEAFRSISSASMDTAIDVDYVKNVVGIIAALFDSLAGMHVFNIIDGMEHYNGKAAMESTIEALEVLNSDMSIITQFFDNMEGLVGKYSLSDIGSMVGIIKTLGEALLTFATNNISDIAYTTDGLLNLQTIEPDLLINAFRNIFTALDDYIKNEQNVESIKSSGKTMASYLFEGMQEAFNTDTSLQLHITPVIDGYNLSTGQMPDLSPSNMSMDYSFGNDIAEFARMAVNNPYYDAEKDLYNLSYLNSIDSRLENMERRFDENISGVSSALASAKVVVDPGMLTRAIGPYVDAYLTEVGRIWLSHASTDVVSM